MVAWATSFERGPVIAAEDDIVGERVNGVFFFLDFPAQTIDRSVFIVTTTDDSHPMLC